MLYIIPVSRTNEDTTAMHIINILAGGVLSLGLCCFFFKCSSSRPFSEHPAIRIEVAINICMRLKTRGTLLGANSAYASELLNVALAVALKPIEVICV